MEGVKHKVSWEVHHRVGKPIPHPHPYVSWQIRREVARMTLQILIFTEDQLEEDAEWNA